MKKTVLVSLAIFSMMSILLTSTAFAQKRVIIKSSDGDEKKMKVVDVKGAFIGIYMDDLDKDRKKEFDYPKSDGVWIMEIIDDSPADKAGLEENDIIYMFGGEKVASADKLREIIKGKNPGDMVDVMFYREGKKQEIRLELGEQSKQFYKINITGDDENSGSELGDRSFTIDLDGLSGEARMMEMAFMGEDRLRLGVKIHKMNKDLAGYFDVDEGKGVLILDVIEDSAAKEAGMKAGDVIVSIDDEAIKDPEGLIETLGAFNEDKEKIKVTVLRKGKKMTFSLDVDDLSKNDEAMIWVSPSGEEQKYKHFKMNMPRIEKRSVEFFEDADGQSELKLDKLKKELEILEKRLKKLEKDKD